jgi:hypothetical protein
MHRRIYLLAAESTGESITGSRKAKPFENFLRENLSGFIVILFTATIY